ncbi:Endonuclease 8 [Pirellulimonas nuda]|uniref:DNA-(apurinic or apyrimidinic site) lyase n=1 Tax=Pirellulimonas nuda TaxID=2528009 RepID=A0A518DEE8_9BACT|nr:DNA-formamidopyrimidine glycosylase family protein [Pirellulimonas nuda]QDU89843.1 Endonuclease 8 [Pirellulimonas nuda]
MPEGDTIFRSAVQLRRAIEGRAIDRADVWDRLRDSLLGGLAGRTITAVEARGKHLLMHLSQGGAIHSHMGMTGSWHLYPAGEPWQKPASYAALTLTFDGLQAVCFTPKTLEHLSSDALRRHPHLSGLGPDLLAGEFAMEEAVARLRGAEGTPLGVAVMNQRLVSGIGNVYKSEVLFLQKLDPFADVAAYSDDELRAVLAVARRHMLRNLDGRPRATRVGAGARLWVYHRSGGPCLKCEGPIAMQRQGEAGRSTYWCPACQPSRRSSDGSAGCPDPR